MARDGTIKPIANLDSLTCLKQLLRNYASHFIERNRIDMLQIINDIFYSGYNRQVIECLGEISQICGGRFKRAAQVKLLNTCYIILTRQKEMFPLNLEEQFLSSGDILAYDIGGKKGQGEEERKQPNSARGTNVGSGDKSRMQASALDQSLDGTRGGSQTERDSAVGTPRYGTLSDLPSSSPSPAQAAGRQLAGLGEPVSRGMTELREHANVSSTTRPKRQLKEFYEAVLDKENQKFLYNLVKQSCITQKDDKTKKTDDQGATERTQMVTLALRTLQMFDF